MHKSASISLRVSHTMQKGIQGPGSTAGVGTGPGQGQSQVQGLIAARLCPSDLPVRVIALHCYSLSFISMHCYSLSLHLSIYPTMLCYFDTLYFTSSRLHDLNCGDLRHATSPS